jgi:hypothetical protein
METKLKNKIALNLYSAIKLIYIMNFLNTTLYSIKISEILLHKIFTSFWKTLVKDVWHTILRASFTTSS